MIDLLLGVICEVRAESHYERHGGLMADSLYHVSIGERPTCGAEEATIPPISSSDETEEGDGKSRYCRKRWFC